MKFRYNIVADGIPKRKYSTIPEGISTPAPAPPVDKMQIITKAFLSFASEKVFKAWS
jgi:hypothetical protein